MLMVLPLPVVVMVLPPLVVVVVKVPPLPVVMVALVLPPLPLVLMLVLVLPLLPLVLVLMLVPLGLLVLVVLPPRPLISARRPDRSVAPPPYRLLNRSDSSEPNSAAREASATVDTPSVSSSLTAGGGGWQHVK